jgi:hypothetical protein
VTLDQGPNNLVAQPARKSRRAALQDMVIVEEILVRQPLAGIDHRHAQVALQACRIAVHDLPRFGRIPGPENAPLGRHDQGDLNAIGPGQVDQLARRPVGVGQNVELLQGRKKVAASRFR